MVFVCSRDMSTDAPATKAQPQSPDVVAFEQAQALMQTIGENLGEQALASFTNWLARELDREQYARLEQAGHHAENRIALARVFVDLSVSSSPVEERDNDGADAYAFRFLQFLCKPASDRRRDGLAGRRRRVFPNGEVYEAEDTESLPNGVVLVGGPGQGKSTLGQLLCQLHRAWLLKPVCGDLSEESQKKAVHAFTNEAARKDLGMPAEIAFPIRIILPDAAAWLAEQESTADTSLIPQLLQFVAEKVQAKGITIEAADLAAIVRDFPTVLVLDGLDEVAAIEDRQRLVAAMKSLFAYARPKPLSLVVVTTRPQGYAEEVDEFPKLHLIPLGRFQALQYATRLVNARFEDERRDIVYRRLQDAASGETTARLMRSPLQITIMATLVDHLGRAPNERWTLFKEYYRVIYEREMERPGDASQLLRDYRKYIDKIHTQVGLLLQIEAEHSGGTASAMTMERFRQVVDAVLAEDEIDGAERNEVARRMTGQDRSSSVMKLIGQRLVLLVEETPGKVNFEVRSIQEFMAAWALSLKDEKTVERRMWRIVKAASFRNVLLFLASRAFTDLDLQGLRDALVERICPELNNDPDDPLARATLAGSMLALEILDEGSALKQTKYVKKLVQLASRIVELPPSAVHARLVRVLLREPDIMRASQSITESAIMARLALPAVEDGFGAWVVLLDLAAQGETWAQQMADARWDERAAGMGKLLGYALDQAEIAPRSWLGEFLGRRFAVVGGRSTIRRDLLAPERFEDELAKQSAYILRLAQGDITPEEATEGAKQIAQSSSGPRYPLGHVFKALEHVPDDAPHVTPILLALVENAPPVMFWWRSKIIERLRRIAGSRPTLLDNDEVWTDLALPLPHPARKKSPTNPPPLDTQQPVRIQSIRLQSVRTIESLQFEPAPPHNGSGQWIVLLGENGTGKTTILRSLVLALRRIGTLPDTAYNPSFRRQGIGRDGLCSVETKVNGTDYRVRVDVDKQGLDYPVRDASAQEMSAPFLIFAYGARRGSALGGAKPSVDFDSPKEIETLFTEGAGTNHAEPWLIPIYFHAQASPEGSPPRQKWEAIQSVLFALLPGLQRITVETTRIWFEGDGLNKTTISGLSDGYLMTLGWVVDLLSRYLHAMEQRNEAIDQDFNEKMTGLVIIDEPDEFLHPAWQRNLIAKVRTVFPKMSFFVTTHNPLTLLGAKAEEIWQLERRDGTIVPVQGRETPALMTGSGILDAYFGIESVFPSELGDMRDRYGFLARNPVRTDQEDAEMHDLLAKLRAREIEPGIKPVSRDLSALAELEEESP